jgi:hypothetical protein
MTAFLDELARSLARPMSRSRAVRLMGGALVSVTVPGIAARAARAGTTFHTCERDGGFLCQCPAGRGLFFKICCEPEDAYTCKCGKDYAQCKKKPCEQCGVGNRCCPPDYCANRNQLLCCKKGEEGCGPRCCKKNEECTTIRVGTGSERVCEKRCPQGQAACDKPKCCPRGYQCVFGATGRRCRRCGPDQVECGKKCCYKQWSKCCGPAGCCPRSSSCCGSVCADTKTDPRNCGQCGNVCESGICSGGICALP